MYFTSPYPIPFLKKNIKLKIRKKNKEHEKLGINNLGSKKMSESKRSVAVMNIVGFGTRLHLISI